MFFFIFFSQEVLYIYYLIKIVSTHVSTILLMYKESLHEFIIFLDILFKIYDFSSIIS